jgi:hypothetical protein
MGSCLKDAGGAPLGHRIGADLAAMYNGFRNGF